MAEPFWRTKSLEEMTEREWESLCDHCGRCCLVKLEDEDTGEIFTTGVICALYDTRRCRCSDYENRHARMPDCIDLSPGNVAAIPWLPATCAYRLLAEGRDLPPWHPLRTRDPRTVKEAGLSVCGQVVSEAGVREEDLPAHMRQWPFMDDAGGVVPAERGKKSEE